MTVAPTGPVRRFVVDRLEVRVHDDDAELAEAAAVEAVETVAARVAATGTARVMFASGDSQLAFLDALARLPDPGWASVTGFHMDEYLGLGADHPASFRRYMRERVVARLPLAAFHELAGDAPDPAAEVDRYAALLTAGGLDLCCLGIGENGHLAFNDPHEADFDDPLTVKVVELDDACRRQQVGEGHFPTVADVPARAATVTIPGLLRAERVLAVVPDARKAVPVRDALEGPVSARCPASVLRRHPHATLHLDAASSSLLERR